MEGSTRSSFHSTLNSLNGLLYYEKATGGNDQLRAARRASEEYLLERRLMRLAGRGPRRTVGYAVPLPFPLALQRARGGGLLPGGGARHPGRVWFDVDVEPGRASKWLMLSGTRVLARWDDPAEAAKNPK